MEHRANANSTNRSQNRRIPLSAIAANFSHEAASVLAVRVAVERLARMQTGRGSTRGIISSDIYAVITMGEEHARALLIL